MQSTNKLSQEHLKLPLQPSQAAHEKCCHNFLALRIPYPYAIILFLALVLGNHFLAQSDSFRLFFFLLETQHF